MVRREFIFVGEALWLDFVNTEAAPRGMREDFVSDIEALADWLEVSLKLNPAEVETWRCGVTGREGQLWTELRTLRHALRTLCEISFGETKLNSRMHREIYEIINRQLQRPARSELLAVEGQAIQWRRQLDLSDPLNILEPIARSAADTLMGGGMSRVKKCSNHACILWFLDTSKNGLRRWCSMDRCGNRNKAAKHYQRSKSGE